MPLRPPTEVYILCKPSEWPLVVLQGQLDVMAALKADPHVKAFLCRVEPINEVRLREPEPYLEPVD